MNWTVTLSWTGNTINLHDFDGANLVLDDGFEREQVLHNDLKPVQDRCAFRSLWRTSLANTLLQIDPDEIVTVEITRDGFAFFYGYLRPVTRWRVTNEPDSVIEFEALDNSWRLQRTLPSAYIAKYVTVSQAVTALLDLAGYDSADYDVPTIDVQVGSILEQDATLSFWDILSEILYSYGYTFYFDSAGVFRVYDWSVETAPTPAGFINDDNAQLEVEVDRQIDDYDGVEVEWFEVREGNWDVVSRTIPRGGAHPPSPTEDNPNSLVHRYELGSDSEGRKISRVLSVDNQTIRGSGKTRVLRSFDIDWSFVDTTSGFAAWVSYTFVSGPASAIIQLDPGMLNSLLSGSYRVTADVEYTVKRDPWQTNPNAVKPLKVKGDYIYSETAAKRLANIIERRTKHSQYLYTARSSTVYNVGDYVTLQISYLNLDTTARVVKRQYVESEQPQGVDVYRYELEGVAVLGTLFGQLTGGIITETASSARTHHAINAAAEGLDGSGNVVQAIRGNFIRDSQPDQTGLYMMRDFLGFYNVTDPETLEGEWVARIENDNGTGKFRVGATDEYVEWDGNKLNIQGSAQSANFVTGVSGWRIDVDGTAEFDAALIRGEIEATTGAIGGWAVTANTVESTDETVQLRSDAKRFEVRDTFGDVKVALGFLGNGAPFTTTEYGLYIAPGNRVRIEGGGEFVDGNYRIESDAAYIVEASGGHEAVRLGSLGLGDVGIDIGGLLFSGPVGGGGASGTFGDIIGGGGADSSFSGVLGGGGAGYGAKRGLLYQQSTGDLTILGGITVAASDVTGLGALATEDVVELAKLGTTIIDGGFLRTDLIEAGSINGDRITAGSIKADRLDVADLFAQGITATGSITGLDLFGGSIDIGDGDFLVNSSGAVSAQSINVTGSIQAGTGNNSAFMSGLNPGSSNVAFWAGHQIADLAPFSITFGGNLRAKSGELRFPAWSGFQGAGWGTFDTPDFAFGFSSHTLSNSRSSFYVINVITSSCIRMYVDYNLTGSHNDVRPMVVCRAATPMAAATQLNTTIATKTARSLSGTTRVGTYQFVLFPGAWSLLVGVRNTSIVNNRTAAATISLRPQAVGSLLYSAFIEYATGAAIINNALVESWSTMSESEPFDAYYP